MNNRMEKFFSKMSRLSVWLVGILLLSLVVVSCRVDDVVSAPSSLVVEGWIEDQGFPIVKVTRSVSLGGDFVNLSELDHYVEHWAKVTVSDGEQEVILTGKYDKRYYPPFIYTTGFLRGKAGKTYRLTVDAPDGSHAEATTTIPAPAPIDSFRVEEVTVGDSTMCQLYGYTAFRGPCKLFTRELMKETEFGSAYLGIYDSTALAKDGCMAINRSRDGLSSGHFTPFFREGAQAYVKFVTLTPEGYRFWRGFEDMASLSRNPLFPMTDNLPGNVHGGLGCWLGYGAMYYVVKASARQSDFFSRACFPDSLVGQPAY